MFPTRIRWLNREDVEKALPVSEAVEAVREAYISSYQGGVSQPPRMRIEATEADGVHLFMPSYDAGLGRTALKVVSVFPENVQRNLPPLMGLVALFDSETGAPLAVMDGGVFTAIRTGAASGVSVHALARPDARVVAVIGAGAQAPYQALGVCAVRPIERIHLYNRTRSRAESLAHWLQERLGHIRIEVFSTVEEAVRDADVICTATSAARPVLPAAAVKPGTHINAVGSFRQDMREFDRGVLERAGRVFVEQRSAALQEAGEVVDALGANVIAERDLIELGAVLAGEQTGRRERDEITVFKSTGIAAKDLYAAAYLYRRADLYDIGTQLDL